MTDTAAVARLVAEIGPLDDEVLAAFEVAPGEWAVRYSGIEVALEHDAAGGRLMMTATIGAPRPESALRLYELLLSYNLLWRDTGGIRMALLGAGGEAVQMADLTLAGLTAADLAGTLSGFARRAGAWRLVLASEEPAAALSAAEHHLRV